MKIYLINPKFDYPMYLGHEVLKDTVFYSDGTAVAIAGIFSSEGFDVEVCDENISPINFETNADYIGITGKTSQIKSITRIAKQFKVKNKKIIIGGPITFDSFDIINRSADVIVIGEIEDIAHDLCDDLKNKSYKYVYRGTQPNVITSSLPRWDLYPNDKSLCGVIQTSRGCFHNCDYCSVTTFYGNKIRKKDTNNVMNELELLFKSGYKYVLVSDDNFLPSKELLIALKDWNKNKIMFAIQSSLELINEQTLKSYADIGVMEISTGVETYNKKTLKDAHKYQNINEDIANKVDMVLSYGISVIPNMMVGFDSDDIDVFDKHFDFAMSLPAPIYFYNILTAPAKSPLYNRLKSENRIDENQGYTGIQWDTNIIHKNISKDELVKNTIVLVNRLYIAENFGSRLEHFISKIKRKETLIFDSKIERVIYGVFKYISKLSSEDMLLCRKMFKYKEYWVHILPFIIQYAQMKYLLNGRVEK